jgi:hypothetical protein
MVRQVWETHFGGAVAGRGPAPDPNALRRDRPSDRDGWRVLPRRRQGTRPRWPLLPDIGLRARLSVAERQAETLEYQLDEAPDGKRSALEDKLTRVREKIAILEFQVAEQDRRERQLWGEVWKTPQACIWEEHGWGRDVAQYVRHKVLAELGSLDDAKEARQWSDRLGLNPLAMQRNRWKIATDEVTTRRAATPSEPRASSRDRLKVAGGAGG